MAHDPPQLTDARAGTGAATTSEVITTRTSRIHLDGDGIVHVVILPGTDQTLADAKAEIGVVARLTAGRRRPVLVDVRGSRAIDRAARAFYAGPEAANCYAAAALLVFSPLTRAMGNFFLGLNKPLMRTKLFDDEEEALRWLTNYRD